MRKYLAEALEKVAEARSEAEVWKVLHDFVRESGFNCLHTWFGRGVDDARFLTTCPDWWPEWYMREEKWRVDHVAAHNIFGRGIIPYGFDFDRHNPSISESSLEMLRFLGGEVGVNSGLTFPVFECGGGRCGGVNLGIAGEVEDLDAMPTSHVFEAVSLVTAGHDRIRSLSGLSARRANLSAREKECLLWLTHGLKTKEIADRLSVSDATVNFHIANAKAKLGADTREQAVAKAIMAGIIIP